MKELFVRESDDRRIKFATVITLIAAFLFLIVFAGCAPAKQADPGGTPPAATEQPARP